MEKKTNKAKLEIFNFFLENRLNRKYISPLIKLAEILPDMEIQ